MSDYPAHRASDDPFGNEQPTAPPWAAQAGSHPPGWGPPEITAPQGQGFGHGGAQQPAFTPPPPPRRDEFPPQQINRQPLPPFPQPQFDAQPPAPDSLGGAFGAPGPGAMVVGLAPVVPENRIERRYTDSSALQPVNNVPPGGFPQQPVAVTTSRYYTPAGPRAQYGPPPQPEMRPTSVDLSTASLLGQRKAPPERGWRRMLYTLSAHKINLGDGAKATREKKLLEEVQQPLQGSYKIALLSLKGGVGKTTITATLGSTFSSIRGDRVIAVDANPDRGTLSQKVPLETVATVRHLLRDEQSIQRYSDVRSYTSQGPSRLEVLASETDPAVSEAFSAEDYSRTVSILERFYSIILTDCGTGLMHSAMSSVLQEADTLIVVSSGSVDGARSASATLDWLDAHGHRALVRRSVAVINAVRPKSGKVDMQKVVDHFSRRCRAVRVVPFDPHLEEGAEISLDRLKPVTRKALVDLASVVAQDFMSTQQTLPALER